MKASLKDLQDAVDLALRDVKGDPATDWYYTSGTNLEAYTASKPSTAGVKYHIVKGTEDVLESFVLHLAIILSGEAYGVGNTGFPTMIDARDMLETRKELLKIVSVYETDDEPNTFDMWIDDIS